MEQQRREKTELGLERESDEWSVPYIGRGVCNFSRAPESKLSAWILFWVRKPQGEMRSRAGLAFLWPHITLDCVPPSPWGLPFAAQSVIWKAFKQSRPHMDCVSAQSQNAMCKERGWQHIEIPFFYVYVLSSISTDTVRGSHWQPADV